MRERFGNNSAWPVMKAGVLAAAVVVGAACGAGAQLVAPGGSNAAVSVEAPVSSAPRDSSGSAAAEPVRDARPAASSNESRPLGAGRAPIGGTAGSGAAGSAGQGGASGAGGGSILDHWLVRTAGSLAIVIGLIFGLKWGVQVWATKMGGVAGQLGAGGRSPSGVLTVLGRYPVARGLTLVLLKLDARVLLLSQSAAGFTTLCQITDPDEVAGLLLRCRDAEGESMAAKFSAILKGLENDPSLAGEEVVGPTTPRMAMGIGASTAGPESAPAAAASPLRARLGALRDLKA
ncbi:MAG: flagellar biosynthetic protein FliO [Phycisphaerales bacterium]|nr:flagellar biosynthetic protein FliO [Phycisphaerales bacterium]